LLLMMVKVGVLGVHISFQGFILSELQAY
jgi:hypothetical protein